MPRGAKKSGRGGEVCCGVCGKNFYVTPNRLEKAKYCSRKCYFKSDTAIALQKNLKHDNWLGKKRSPETIEKIREKKKGVPIWSLKQRIEIGKRQKGEKHWNWQGGKTKEGKRVKLSIEYSLFRKAVLARDKYTCQHCQKVIGNNLEVHHIKSFADYPKLRCVIENGITLCKKCHKKTDNYSFGNRNHTKEAKFKMRLKKLGRKLSSITREKMSIAHKKYLINNQKVHVFNK